MLILHRQLDQTIVIGDNIKITVIKIRGDTVDLGIDAPKDIPVYRKEIYDAIMQQKSNDGAIPHEKPTHKHQ